MGLDFVIIGKTITQKVARICGISRRDTIDALASGAQFDRKWQKNI